MVDNMMKIIKLVLLVCLFPAILSATELRKVIIMDTSGDTLELEANGGVPVNIQDQTSPTMIVPMNKTLNTTTLSTGATLDARTIEVTSATGFIDGAFIVIANVAENRYYTGQQLGAISGSTVTLDSPLDFSYPSASVVTNGITNMAVDGSSTTQIFSLRASDPGLPVVMDVTRIIFHCLTDSAIDLSMFADIAGGITNGIVLRRTDSVYNNIFNAKSNYELAGLMFDFSATTSTNPVQGQDGFIARLTFAGPSKMGVAIRLGPDDDLELLIQDDLSTITSFHVIVEGHVVTD